MKSFTNISYFGVNTSELVIERATYHDNRVFLLSQKKSPLFDHQERHCSFLLNDLLNVLRPLFCALTLG